VVDGGRGRLFLASWSACRRMTVLDLFMWILKASPSAAKHSALMAEARRLQMQAIIPSVASDGCVCVSPYTARIRSAKAVLSSLDGAFRALLRDTLDCRRLTFYAIIAIPTSARARPAPREGRVFGFVSVLTAINLKIHQRNLWILLHECCYQRNLLLSIILAKSISSYKLLPTRCLY